MWWDIFSSCRDLLSCSLILFERPISFFFFFFLLFFFNTFYSSFNPFHTLGRQPAATLKTYRHTLKVCIENEPAKLMTLLGFTWFRNQNIARHSKREISLRTPRRRSDMFATTNMSEFFRLNRKLCKILKRVWLNSNFPPYVIGISLRMCRVAAWYVLAFSFVRLLLLLFSFHFFRGCCCFILFFVFFHCFSLG